MLHLIACSLTRAQRAVPVSGPPGVALCLF